LMGHWKIFLKCEQMCRNLVIDILFHKLHIVFMIRSWVEKPAKGGGGELLILSQDRLTHDKFKHNWTARKRGKAECYSVWTNNDDICLLLL
jgi:hypothetical protein